MALSINELTEIISESYRLNQESKVTCLRDGYLITINGALFNQYREAVKYLKESREEK